MMYDPYDHAENERVLALVGAYLNERPDFIGPEAMRAMTEDGGIPQEEAYRLLLAAGCGLDIADNAADRALYRRYFPQMVRGLSAAAYAEDPYYAQVCVPQAKAGQWALTQARYAPYEAFVCDDLLALPDGRVVPQLGYFSEGFTYPAVEEAGRIWMTVTPNEIETMRAPIARCRGRVLALGLGLGYFAFMASVRPEVTRVDVVERSPAVVALFRQHILPQFPQGGKVRIVEGDAFEYLENRAGGEGYQVVFADLWHDVSDGLAMRARIRELESRVPGAEFMYWIEKSMRCYQD